MGVVTVGVDIGQKRDPTAIAVVDGARRQVEPVELVPEQRIMYALDGPPPRMVPKTEPHYEVRYLDRLPLGTPYPEVGRRVVEICAGLSGRSREGVDLWCLYVDATGVGQPVVDVLIAEGIQRHVQLVPVYFTYGDRRLESTEGGHHVTLGKAWLVSRLQVLLQGGRLHLPPDHREAAALARELADYEIHVDENANEKYGAFKVGAHDDLVTAIGLAVQDERALAFA